MDERDSTPVKTCTKCKETKPTTEFPKHSQQKSGLDPQCKACKSARMALYRAANKEKGSDYAKAWAAANPEKKKANKKRYYDRHAKDVIEKSIAWRTKNAEHVKAYDAARYWSDPTAGRERVAAYRAANPERVKEYSSAYRLENLEAYRIHEHNRRERKRGNGGQLSSGLFEKLFKLQKGLCPCCKQPLGDTPHLDHIMPLALGGANSDDNMQLLRSSCNQQKHAKHAIDYMQSKGYLL